MKQLLRAYITNLGIQAAWFHNFVYEFCDKNDTPLDTVIVADNQGGKTTSLSFVLNTLHPREDRFIQTLDPENNHKFDDYLDSYYNQPGIVVLEFDRGEPTGQVRLPSIALPKKHFLAGQFIVIDSQGNKYRRFFSMLCSKGVSLKKLIDGSAPCEGFALKDLKNLNDVKDWISGMRERFQGRGDSELAVVDFNLMDSQAAWTKHLLDQFGIDPELVSLQVDMNGKEGAAAEANMFKFRDEKDFLQKFTRFCLNRDDAENTVRAVRAGLDKIQDIPRYERQLLALRAIQDNMKPFTDAAEELAIAKQSLRKRKETGLGLKREVDQAVEDAKQALGDLECQKNEFTNKYSAAEEEKRNTDNLIRGLQDFLQSIKIRDLKSKYDTENAKLQSMLYQETLFKAKQDLDLIDTEKARLKQHEDLLNDEMRSVKNLKIATENAGRDFLTGINTNLLETENEIENINAVINTIEENLTALDDNTEILGNKLRELQSNKSKLEFWQEFKMNEKARLVKEDVLAIDESAKDALERLQLDNTEKIELLSALKTKQTSIDSELSELRNKRIPETSKHCSEIEISIKQIEDNLNNEKIRSNTLRLQAKELGLSDTTDIDLDSPSLLSDLQNRRGRVETQSSRLYIEKDTLTQDKRCIETFGIRGIDPEVFKVVEAAQACDVEAQPFSYWLAEQLPNKPEEAREVYLSDTAKFSGVLIYSQEKLEALATNRHFQSLLQLERPITVSLPSVEPSPDRQSQIILKPKDDSLYNKASAAERLEKIAEDILQIDTNISRAQKILEAMDGFKAAYDNWLREFGNGKRQFLQSTLIAKKNECEKLKTELEKLTQNVLDAEQSLIDVKDSQRLLEVTQEKLQLKIENVKRYNADYESLYEAKSIELSKTKTDIEKLSVIIEENKEAKQKLKTDSQVQHKALKPHFERRAVLVEQKAAVNMFIEPESTATIATPLEELAAIYATYHERYKLALSGKIYDLHAVYEEIQSGLNQKQTAYANNYPQVVDSEVRSIDGHNLSTKIESLRPQIDALHSEVSRIDREMQKAEIKQNMKREEWEERREDYCIPENMDLKATTVLEIETALNVKEDSSKHIFKTIQNYQNNINVLKQKVKTLSDIIGVLEQASSKLEDFEEDGISPQPFMLTINLLSFDKDILEASVKESLKKIKQAKSREEKAREQANDAHNYFLRSLEEDLIKEHAQQERAILAANGHRNFNSFCEQAGNIRNHLDERMEAIQQQINDKESDIEICAKQLGHLVESGISLLRKATRIKVPSSVARIGDQPIIKLVQAHLDPQAPLFDLMKERIRSMASEPIKPLNGQQLVADILWNITHERGRGLNIKLLKPEPGNIGFNHYSINSLSSCGGEMLTIALMLYMVNARLRAEAHGRHLGKCGSLFLDNPFGKANKPWLVEIQRSLASALGIQLIYLSGIKDINTLFKFGHHLHLRLAGFKDKKTGRQSVETVRLEINEHAVA